MNQTGSLRNIMTLIGFTLLVIALARVQPMSGVPGVMAAENRPQASTDLNAGGVAHLANEQDTRIRALCGKTQVQYHKLEGYKRCLAEHQVGYDTATWCPIVRTFCDAQWYPFGDRASCFTERGCPES